MGVTRKDYKGFNETPTILGEPMYLVFDDDDNLVPQEEVEEALKRLREEGIIDDPKKDSDESQ